MAILDIPVIAQTRRHHALEHATIKILNRRFPALRLVGWSTPQGFYMYGPVSMRNVRAAVDEALARLRRGESHLAIHPRCGTNLVTSGILVGLLAFLTMLPGPRRSRRERLPLVLLLSTLALTFAEPLGALVQEHVTTQANINDSLVAQIDTYRTSKAPIYRIQLGQAGE